MTEEENRDETAIVRCGTSKGPIAFEFHREWSPLGYDRAVELFDRGYYDKSHFFRVIPNFLVQFGISYTDDQELKQFASTPILDDPKHEPEISFQEGIISYAGSGDNSRTSQLFVSYGSAASLGTQKWETPIGKVIEGMEHIRGLHSYGDGPPGKGPAQGKIHTGRKYIDENFPLLDSFETCTVERSEKNKVPKQNAEEEKIPPKQQEVIADKWKEPRKIAEEGHEKTKHHKESLGNFRLSETRRPGDAITMFAAFGVIMLAVLLVFGYRSSGKKRSKHSD